MCFLSYFADEDVYRRFQKHNYVLSFIHCHAICVYIVFLLLIARLMRLVIILPAEVSFFFCGVVVRCSRAEPKVQGSSPTELFFFFFLFFSVSTSSFYRLMVIILVLSNMQMRHSMSFSILLCLTA